MRMMVEIIGPQWGWTVFRISQFLMIRILRKRAIRRDIIAGVRVDIEANILPGVLNANERTI